MKEMLLGFNVNTYSLELPYLEYRQYVGDASVPAEVMPFAMWVAIWYYESVSSCYREPSAPEGTVLWSILSMMEPAEKNITSFIYKYRQGWQGKLSQYRSMKQDYKNCCNSSKLNRMMDKYLAYYTSRLFLDAEVMPVHWLDLNMWVANSGADADEPELQPVVKDGLKAIEYHERAERLQYNEVAGRLKHFEIFS